MDGLMLTSELIAPYRHLVFASLVSDVVEQDLLKTLENAAWVSRAASFYRFDVIEDSNIRLALLRMIVDDAGLRNRRPEFEDIFECRLSNDFKLESHRYGNGAGIGAHTDALTPEVRCVLSLNRGWNASKGGIWVLASDSALQVNPTYLPSLSNTGFIFATAANSFHALSVCNDAAFFGLTIRIPRVST